MGVVRKVAWTLAVGAALSHASLLAAEEAAKSADPIEEIVVSGDASLSQRLGEVGSFSALDGDEIDFIGAVHPFEALARVPGVWISRGSGQEHLTSIRSAVLTGAGACGEFLFLENSIPIRPAGFCNVNNLFEMNTEQAGRIEVWRGPSSAVLGGNALHGAINTLTAIPDRNSIGLEYGSYDSYRLSGQFRHESGGHEIAGSIHGSGTDGYRDDTGHDQQKVSLIHKMNVAGFDVENTFNFTNLNQETGAYVLGKNAYKDDELRKTNPSPEAYRDARSVRLASRGSKDAFYFVPYLRHSDMEFLQHFLPGEPRERNDQTSTGVLAGFEVLTEGPVLMDVGAQIEYMSGHLDQWQAEPLTTSSGFNNAVRPEGWHYDYDVESAMLAGFYNLSWEFAEGTRLVNSLRLEYMAYDYDNKMLDGNSRDDGTTCGFGGCLYNRPADRDDDFTNLAGRLGVEKDMGQGISYLTFGSGFRPPQATELYRLQRGQDVADLDSESLLSLEIGYRGEFWNVAGFAEKNDNFIFRDAAGFNVSDGKTKAWGIEFEAFKTFGMHGLAISGTYAEHKYDFDRDISGRETIAKNDYVDTAPKWLVNARWNIRPNERFDTELEAIYVDDYFINAANTATYEGHLVFNLRGRYQVSNALTLTARVMNLFDKEYADRADWTEFNDLNYRYFPAMPRQLYVGATYSF
jgi:iron complex outermembrane receptor protein